MNEALQLIRHFEIIYFGLFSLSLSISNYENSTDLQDGKPGRFLIEETLYNNTQFERRKTNFSENSVGALVNFILEMRYISNILIYNILHNIFQVIFFKLTYNLQIFLNHLAELQGFTSNPTSTSLFYIMINHLSINSLRN